MTDQIEFETVLSHIVPAVSCERSERLTERGSIWQFKFPVAPQSDYAFSFYLYPEGERGISATRVGASEREFFWNKQFEAADYKNLAELQRDFTSAVEAVLCRETFVLQKDGFVWTTFTLAYKAGDQGEVISWIAGPRLTFKTPSIEGRKHYYRSFPLGEDQSTQPATTEGGSRTILFFDSKARE